MLAATNLSGGTHTVTITDADGCSSNASVVIAEPSEVAAPTANGITSCIGAPATLTASGSSGTFDWYDVLVGGTSVGSGASFTTPNLTASTTYYVEATDGSCLSQRIAVDVTVQSCTVPTADFFATVTSDCEGSSIQFVNTSTGGPTSYEWVFVGGTPSASTLQNPAIMYNSAGTYDIYLKAINGAGDDTNVKTDYITINVCLSVEEEKLENVVKVYPNPNNGLFNVEMTLNDKDDYTLSVRNVLGQQVYVKQIEEYSGTQTITVDLSTFEEGVYLLTVSSSKDSLMKRIIKSE